MKWIIHGSEENPKQHMFDITTTGYQSQNIKTVFVCLYLPTYSSQSDFRVLSNRQKHFFMF